MGGDLWSGGKKSRKLASRFRKSIAQELGVKRLPNIQEMLSLQVQAGELDPDDDDAVFDAIKRLKNPLHPDTRAMYSLYAQVQNPDLKEEELIEFINGPYKQRVAEFETEEGKKSLEKEWDRRWNEIEDEHKHTGVGDTLSDYWKSLGQTDISMDDFSVPKKPENWNSMSFEEKKDFMENTDFGGAYQSSP